MRGLDDDVSDMERWEATADLYSGVAHPIRVAIVESLVDMEDRPLTEVAEQFDVSRSAVQKHVDKLEAADLVYRPQDEDRHYALTPLGVLIGGRVVRESWLFEAAVSHVAEAEKEARAELGDVPLGEAALEKAVTARKWELVEDELSEALDTGFLEVPDIDEFDAFGEDG